MGKLIYTHTQVMIHTRPCRILVIGDTNLMILLHIICQAAHVLIIGKTFLGTIYQVLVYYCILASTVKHCNDLPS